MKNKVSKNVGARFCAIVLSLLLAQHARLFAESVAAHYKEGAEHGFLVLRTMDDKIVAGRDLVQLTQGDRVTSHEVFRFKDGSVDDEKSVFMQRGSFRLISDRHTQKGPTFHASTEVSIDTRKGQVTSHFGTNADDKKSDVEQLDLPPDLANGMILNVIKNIPPSASKTTLSYLVAAPKPRLVKLGITAQGEEGFTIAGFRHKATHFVIKVELGGITGIVAPLIGKQPADMNVWVVQGGAPAFLRWEGPFFSGGPIWKLEMVGPVWDRVSETSSHRPTVRQRNRKSG